MSYIKVDAGRAHYCEALIDQPLTVEDGAVTKPVALRLGGILSLGAEAFTLQLHNFDTHFHLGDDEYIVARTADNWFASFTSYVSTGSGSRWGEKQVFSQTFAINTAIIGWKPWLQGDLVRRTRFLVPKADDLLHHSTVHHQIANSRLGSSPANEVVSCPVVGGTVRIYYSWTGNSISDYPLQIWPEVEMEFDEHIPESTVRDRVTCFLQFLSAASSIRFVEDGQTVSKVPHAEWLAEIEAGSQDTDWSIYHWADARDRAPLGEHGGAHGAFATNRDDEERLRFSDCLTEWFRRYPEWEGACSAMMEALSLQNVMNAERLLNVTRWLEATPGTQPGRIFTDDHRSALGKLAARGAENLGYDLSLRGRVKGAVSGIKEDRNLVWKRLVSEIQAVFGEHLIANDLAAWVGKAFSLRGNAAHRPIIGFTEAEYETFSRAVFSAECFALLMLLKDLPMTAEGRRRVGEAPLVRYYQLEIEGSLPPK